MNKKRYYVLDAIRGFALINMILYHAAWDLVYMFDVNWNWYRSNGAYIWQQCICWTFILVSGFCFSFGRNKAKRGAIVFLCGLIITFVTCTIMPESRVVFGILTFLGSCMLILALLEPILVKPNPYIGTICCLFLFLLTRNINEGFLGFEKWNLIALPNYFYQNLLTTYLGFPESGFYSTDYFAILPWIFLFTTGFYLNKIFQRKDWLKILQPRTLKPLEWLGKHSLPIYMIHQPIIYAVLSLFLG